MRRDLRRLLWRLRAGVLRPAAMREGLEEACESLIAARFEVAPQPIEAFALAWPALARFEGAVSRARLLTSEGDHRGAVVAVEAAEMALEAARRSALAEHELDETRAAWSELRARYGLDGFSDLATVRECERVLVLAESFLAAAEPRKARFVLRQCRSALVRLGNRDAGSASSGALTAHLEALRAGPRPPENLLAALERMVAAGAVDLAQRLLADWEMAEPGGGAESDHRTVLGRHVEPIREARREARSLLRDLADLAPERERRGGEAVTV